MTLVIKMCFGQSKELTTICMKQGSFVVVYMTQAESVKSKSSHHSKGSQSSSSAKLRLIEAKARAAALEVEARFMKEKQALRMASEDNFQHQSLRLVPWICGCCSKIQRPSVYQRKLDIIQKKAGGCS